MTSIFQLTNPRTNTDQQFKTTKITQYFKRCYQLYDCDTKELIFEVKQYGNWAKYYNGYFRGRYYRSSTKGYLPEEEKRDIAFKILLQKMGFGITEEAIHGIIDVKEFINELALYLGHKNYLITEISNETTNK